MKGHAEARESDIVIQTVGDETLVYDLKTDKAFCLNRASSAVWNECTGRHSVTEITSRVSKGLGSPVREEFVLLALDQLYASGLLVSELQTPAEFQGLSRREVIRKVGFASTVALPVVSAIVAPKAGAAQSGSVGILAPCTGVSGTQGNCSPGLTCFATVTISTGVGTTPTGINQCCSSGASNIVSGTACVFGACGATMSCAGNPNVAAPNDPNCPVSTCTFF
ncbi:MAG: hypothetical protein R2681_11350 [Pyrinomonadaceae bacterium]